MCAQSRLSQIEGNVQCTLNYKFLFINNRKKFAWSRMYEITTIFGKKNWLFTIDISFRRDLPISASPNMEVNCQNLTLLPSRKRMTYSPPMIREGCKIMLAPLNNGGLLKITPEFNNLPAGFLCSRSHHFISFLVNQPKNKYKHKGRTKQERKVKNSDSNWYTGCHK